MCAKIVNGTATEDLTLYGAVMRIGDPYKALEFDVAVATLKILGLQSALLLKNSETLIAHQTTDQWKYMSEETCFAADIYFGAHFVYVACKKNKIITISADVFEAVFYRVDSNESR